MEYDLLLLFTMHLGGLGLLCLIGGMYVLIAKSLDLLCPPSPASVAAARCVHLPAPTLHGFSSCHPPPPDKMTEFEEAKAVADPEVEVCVFGRELGSSFKVQIHS